jgi:predicted amidohydrolase
MKSKKLTLALAQMALERGKPEHNFRIVKLNVKQAADEGADLVLLPELWASGYDLENCQKYASPISEGWFLKMSSLAADFKIILGGSLIERQGEDYYNTFVLYDWQGELLAAYRKIHLFHLLNEDQFFQAGDQLVWFDSLWGKFGLATCYDLRFPEIFRVYGTRGAELILLVAEWPDKRIFHWHQLLSARAIENQCFVAAVNKVGISNGERLGGGSSVINPMGEILINGGTKEGLLVSQIDLAEVGKARKWMKVMEDRRPTVYRKYLK